MILADYCDSCLITVITAKILQLSTFTPLLVMARRSARPGRKSTNSRMKQCLLAYDDTISPLQGNIFTKDSFTR